MVCNISAFAVPLVASYKQYVYVLVRVLWAVQGVHVRVFEASQPLRCRWSRAAAG